ncbi:lysophospholipid acyltransferase family protein [Terriglobus tenax]|uniref:lysophospholipid acyltransferase family protein n=1 Tax=Terriglobus tenax TaxID=1111115 RepID=UPI0021DFB76F|nr:lysophospholipid acyltransferase family protein [Terriglobus tenax]
MVSSLRILPRSLARMVGAGIGAIAFHLLGRLRKTGMRNLEIAFPAMPSAERDGILRSLYRHLGWQMAEFCQMPGYTSEYASTFIRYEGLNNYLDARDKGRGVLVITGHLGAWELSSYFHSLRGFPMAMVIRRLDNPLVDSFVNGIRCLHGNRVVHKDDSARGLLRAMHQGQTVGILMDTNMTPPQGVFVPYFGTLACTGAGLARVALKTNAAVVPGFLLWNDAEKKYVLHFGPEVELVRTGDDELDAIANTARFTAEIERYVREYPDQWLWVHRRWKTRPEGEAKLY